MNNEQATSQGDNNTRNPESALERLIQRHNGDSTSVAALLFHENFQYRQRIRELERSQPPADAVVLIGDDVKRWEALRTHNPEELAQALREREALQAELSKYKRQALIASAARLVGYDPDVLAGLPNLPAIEVVEEGGKQIAVIVDGVNRSELSDYVQRHYAKFLPALEQNHQNASRNAQPVRLPQQSGASRPVGTFDLDSYLKKIDDAAASTPNPLSPPQSQG